MGILKHMTMSARRSNTSGWKGRLGRVHSPGITSAQHPMRKGSKSVHDSYPPAIIGTASPNLHIEPRRRGDQGKDAGALSLSPATSGTGATRAPRQRPPHPAPVAQWIEQAPSKRLAAGSSPAGGAISQNAPEGSSPPGRFVSPTATPTATAPSRASTRARPEASWPWSSAASPPAAPNTQRTSRQPSPDSRPTHVRDLRDQASWRPWRPWRPWTATVPSYEATTASS